MHRPHSTGRACSGQPPCLRHEASTLARPHGAQIAMPGSLTNPHLCGARFLLKPGRKYQEAVDLFSQGVMIALVRKCR